MWLFLFLCIFLHFYISLGARGGSHAPPPIIKFRMDFCDPKCIQFSKKYDTKKILVAKSFFGVLFNPRYRGGNPVLYQKMLELEKSFFLYLFLHVFPMSYCLDFFQLVHIFIVDFRYIKKINIQSRDFSLQEKIHVFYVFLAFFGLFDHIMSSKMSVT